MNETNDLPTTVYAASAWWRDCDPFAAVVALDPSVAETEIRDAMLEEAERAWGDAEDEDHRSKSDYLDDIAWSGVHKFTLAELGLGDSELTDLTEDGYCWQQ